MNERYLIWCQVWGGITGSRASWLKSEGKVKEFANQKKAEKEAVRLNEIMNGPHAKAKFLYTVMGVD